MAPLSLYISFYTSLAKAISTLIFARLYNPQSPPYRNLKGQNAVVTGANSGIGLSIATALAKQGATVYLACRNVEKGHAAVASIVSQLGHEAATRVFCWKVDVGDLHSVRAFCEKWGEEGRRIDMLVYAMCLGMDTGTLHSYALSKAHQVLFAAILQRRFDSTQDNQRTVHAFTPGFTSTPIFAKFAFGWKTWFTNPTFALLKVTEKYIAVGTDEGAKTGSWLASCGGERGVEGGGYWEWMSRKTSLIDLVEGELGDEEWSKACGRVWRAWEDDSGCTWDVAL